MTQDGETTLTGAAAAGQIRRAGGAFGGIGRGLDRGAAS